METRREQQAIIAADLDIRTLVVALQAFRKLASFCIVFEQTVDASLEKIGVILDSALLHSRVSRHRHLLAIFRTIQCMQPRMVAVKTLTVAAGSDCGVWDDVTILDVAQKVLEDVTSLHLVSHCAIHWTLLSYPVLQTLYLSTLCLSVEALEHIICNQAPLLRTLSLDDIVLSQDTRAKRRPQHRSRKFLGVFQCLEDIASNLTLKEIHMLGSCIELKGIVRRLLLGEIDSSCIAAITVDPIARRGLLFL